MEDPIPTLDADEAPAPLRLVAIELGGWPPLGDDVRLDISPRCTVLVGRNGAGKSLLCEGLLVAVQSVLAPATEYLGPPRFHCELTNETGERFYFERIWDETSPGTADDTESLAPLAPGKFNPVEERFLRGNGQVLWHLKGASLRIGAEIIPRLWPGGTGLLAVRDLAQHLPAPIAREARALRDFLSGCYRVQAGVPRSKLSRGPVVVSRAGGQGSFRYPPEEDKRIGILAATLATAKEHRRDQFEEFVELGRRLALWREVEVLSYGDPQRQPSDPQRRDLARVTFDGVDIGLLADGTLRVAVILWLLLTPRVTTLLIEEPETAVHPGLLWRLLSLVDSYADGRQLVLSTHSPQVVTWAKPQELRLVQRASGVTSARALSQEELAHVLDYLSAEERTLGEYVFSGALGDEP